MTQTSPTSKSIVLTNVILSYAYLAKPQVSKSKEAGKADYVTYRLDAVFDPSSPNLDLVRNTQREIAKAAWGEAPTQAPGPVDPATGQATLVTLPAYLAKLTQLANEGAVCLRDGNKRTKIEEPYQNRFFVAATNKRQPRIVTTRQGVNVEIGAGDPNFPYSGCLANVIVEIWAQGHPGKPSQYGSALKAQLTGVQLVEHRQPLGGGGKIASLDEFGLAPEGADAPIPSGAQAPAANALI
jgi:hypothetical protein